MHVTPGASHVGLAREQGYGPVRNAAHRAVTEYRKVDQG